MSNTLATPQTIYRIQVAVPVYLNDCFDYQVTAEQYAQAEVGARVAVFEMAEGEEQLSTAFGRELCEQAFPGPN